MVVWVVSSNLWIWLGIPIYHLPQPTQVERGEKHQRIILSCVLARLPARVVDRHSICITLIMLSRHIFHSQGRVRCHSLVPPGSAQLPALLGQSSSTQQDQGVPLPILQDLAPERSPLSQQDQGVHPMILKDLALGQSSLTPYDLAGVYLHHVSTVECNNLHVDLVWRSCTRVGSHSWIHSRMHPCLCAG